MNLFNQVLFQNFRKLAVSVFIRMQPVGKKRLINFSEVIHQNIPEISITYIVFASNPNNFQIEFFHSLFIYRVVQFSGKNVGPRHSGA